MQVWCLPTRYIDILIVLSQRLYHPGCSEGIQPGGLYHSPPGQSLPALPDATWRAMRTIRCEHHDGSAHWCETPALLLRPIPKRRRFDVQGTQIHIHLSAVMNLIIHKIEQGRKHTSRIHTKRKDLVMETREG